MRIISLLFLLMLTAIGVSAQEEPSGESKKYLGMNWRSVATKMPADWYGSAEAKLVAENVLLSQKDIGGWAKNKAYHHVFTEGEKQQFINDKPEVGATFDNGATITELRFLAKVYARLKDDRYKQAFDKGLEYILIAQYENGGWPQFYPFRKGNSVAYAAQITYNDNAMLNIMLFLKGVIAGNDDFLAIQVSDENKIKAQQAFDKGVECILKTQILVDGKPTVWCAQHDAKTFAPVAARKFELASFSGAESAGLTALLMDIDDPSADIIAAVNGAVSWFENNKINGIRLNRITDNAGNKDLIVVNDSVAPTLWARFYDLETGKPMFCGRDGIRKFSLAEIDYERRNGYSWYIDEPARLFKKYAAWKGKNE